MPLGTAGSSTELREGSGRECSTQGCCVAIPRDGGTAGSKPWGFPTQAVATGGFWGVRMAALAPEAPLLIGHFPCYPDSSGFQAVYHPPKNR